MNARVVNSVAIYVAILVGFMVLKPTFATTKEGRMRGFGIGKDETLFTPPVIAMAAALTVYAVILGVKK